MEGIEVFYMGVEDFLTADADTWMADRMKDEIEDLSSESAAAADLAGWYWWPCQPGCLPDGEANGPFETENEAYDDAKGE